MSDDTGNESESSLPTFPAPYFPSSPPIIKHLTTSCGSMDDTPRPKSEPPATQVEESKPLAALRNVHSDESERPPSAQQRHVDEDDTNESDDDEELNSDPAEPAVEFDWDELHRRYHDAMKECHDHEGQLTAEWNQLMNVQRRLPVFEPGADQVCSTSASGPTLATSTRRTGRSSGTQASPHMLVLSLTLT